MIAGNSIHRLVARSPYTIRNDTTITFRDALDAANNARGSNTITFAQAIFGQTITLTSNDTQNPFFSTFLLGAGDVLPCCGLAALTVLPKESYHVIP